MCKTRAQRIGLSEKYKYVLKNHIKVDILKKGNVPMLAELRNVYEEETEKMMGEKG